MKVIVRKIVMLMAIVGVTAAFSACGGNFDGQYTGLGHVDRCTSKTCGHKNGGMMYTKGSADQDYQK